MKLHLSRRIVGGAAAVALAASVAAGGGTAARAGDWSRAYKLDVHDVSAPVGGHAEMVATIHFASGYRVLEAYNSRAMLFSSIDDGVAFDRKVIPAQIEDGALVFTVGLKPTKAGTHKINGVLRIGYIEGADTMKMVNVHLIADVTGTQ